MKIPECQRKSGIRGIMVLSYLLLSLLYSIPVNAQPVKEKLISNNSEHFVEELYIQTDRDLYIVGESIWLKVYKLEALNHTLSNVSKVVYLELINEANNPVKRIKVRIENATGSARIHLPDTISTGHYLLRGYTNWMKNDSEKLFFYKTIAVINPFKEVRQIKLPPKVQLLDTILFYPEGGHLIYDIKTKLGFRAFDLNGMGMEIYGAILNETKDTVSFIKTDPEGYGYVHFMPARNTSYHLVTGSNVTDQVEFKLPEPLPSGLLLSIQNEENPGTVRIKISKSKDFYPGGRNFFLLHRTNGFYTLYKDLYINHDSLIECSRSDFPNGIGQFMIADDQNTILSWRWFNNSGSDIIDIEARIDKTEYEGREKVFVNFNIKDTFDKPVEADVLVSVVKSFTLNQHRMNIYNRYQHMPSSSLYSKTGTGNDRMLFVDRSDFRSGDTGLISPFKPEFVPEVEGHIISGRIINAESREPLIHEEVVLSFVGKTARCHFGRTNEMGQFYFVTNESGINEIVIQPLERQDTAYYVELDQSYFNQFGAFAPVTFYLDTSKLEDLNKAIIAMQVQKNYEPIQEKPKYIAQAEDTLHFYGQPEHRVQLDQFIALNSTREIIKELVPEVVITRDQGEQNLKVYHKFGGEKFQKTPFILVDGTPFHNVGKILDMNPSDIETIDILNLKYFVGPVYLDGIIHFITRSGNLSSIDFDYSLFRLAYESCQVSSAFYAPSHTSDTPKDNRIPDLRNTLYWNPDLRTDIDGQATAEFFTSDESGHFSIVIEAMSWDGKVGYTTIPLIVK